MHKIWKNPSLYQTLCVTLTIISPIVAVKLIDLQVSLFSVPSVVPGSAITYPFIFLISNIISERYGIKKAKETAILGLFCEVVSTGVFLFMQILPAFDYESQEAYRTILGSNFIFVIAGAITYFASQSCNIGIYHFLRKLQKVRVITVNILSTAVGQAVDTVVFLSLSYGLGLKYFFNKETAKILFVMILSQYIIRIFLTFITAPVFKLLSKHT